MSKRTYRFGPDYLLKSVKVGVAVLKGEQYYFVTDRYNYWLIADMDVQNQTYELKLWDKPRTRKPHSRKSHWRNVTSPYAIKVRL